MALRTFLGTDGILRDENDDPILITNTTARNNIVGGVVPVDIGTRPNANDGDPLRTSFNKLNNFVLASYQNDFDIQLRVGSLEAGAVFLGMFRADQLPRRSLPDRDTGAGGAWIAADQYNGNYYDELNSAAVPDLEANPDATDVYAQISRSVEGRPALSAVIGNITDTTSTLGEIDIAVVLPDEFTDSDTTIDRSTQRPINGSADSEFPAVVVNVRLEDRPYKAQEIAELFEDALKIKLGNISADYFTFNIEAPTENTRSLTIDYNVKAAAGSSVSIPPELVVITGTAGTMTYRTNLSLVFSGNTSAEGISALPWIDQDISSLAVIPAYTVFQWTRDGWSVADQGRGDIKAEFLFFDDERNTVAISTDFTDATGGNATDAKPEDVTTPSSKEITAVGTRDAIIDVQQFGINYLHSVTIDAGEY